jgi:murein DD-endopeptidase MepM/ murein hydrolase activator NlpD
MRQIGILLLLVMGLAGCGSKEPVPAEATPTQAAVISSPTLQVFSTSEPTSVLFAEANPLPDLPDIPQATVAPDPLRFVFPTPGPAPVSAWRPPLYPTPWAPTAYDHFYFARPIGADEVNWPVADYRYGGEFFEDVVHTGVDIPASMGTPVLAAGSGEIIWAGYGVYRGGYDVTDPYGLAVVIRHDFGYKGQSLYTIYGHLDQIDVAEGQYVTTGQQIGLVGETGRVTGPHLHFEVRVGDNSFFSTLNPELWLVPPVGWGILAGRVLDSSGQPVDAQLIIVHSNLNGQNWFARSYGIGAPNSDPYYRENLVVGDLPAGYYELRTAYGGYSYTMEVEIRPGVVNYFIFDGFDGFIQTTPELPGADFTPEPWYTGTPEP